MGKLRRIIVLVVMFTIVASSASAQQTKIYTDKYKAYKEGMDLFDKGQFQAAQQKFNALVDVVDDSHDEIQINAEYYAAVCALELSNKDAEFLLSKFVLDHPDNTRAKTVYFQLGRHQYRRKRWRDALRYFEMVDPYDLSKKEQIEYHFKKGFAYFQGKKFTKARDEFYEVKDVESEYQVPAIYYYSHIAYQDDKYQVALDGFRKIEKEPMFRAIVPYYIAQILYKQNKFEELSKYGPKFYDSISAKKRPEYARIVGEAFYQLKDYPSAIPYLEEFNRKSSSTRDDYYQLGYAYYKGGRYQEAVKSFGRVTNRKDELNQICSYQMADCYLRLDQKEYARNAFKVASQFDFDKRIQEDALFSYAKLAYELSYNPYDEAIDAFHDYIETYPNGKVDEAYEYLLNVYTTTKNYKAALQSLDRIQNKDARMKTAYQLISFNRGVELYHNHEYNTARKHFKDVMIYPIDPKLNAESLYWIAEGFYYQKKYNVAATSYGKFKTQAGASFTGKMALADYNLGYCYIRDKHYSSSITAFRNFLKNPGNDDNKIADAYLRLGDNYFLLKKDGEAISNYQNALDLGVPNGDYAYFQMARSLDYSAKGDNAVYAKKAIALEKLLEQYPNSNYYVTAIYELGLTYRVQEKNDKALEYFSRIVSDYPQNSNVRKALFKMGVIYFGKGDFARAEDVFNQVIDDYPDSEERLAAIDQVKEVYKAQDRLADYPGWLASKGINAAEGAFDDDFYQVAMQELEAESPDCYKVIAKFEEYLNKVSSPKHAVSAHFHIAQCKYGMEDFIGAITHYDQVIAAPNNEYSEQALVEASEINFYKRKNYQAALSNYATLEKVAQKTANVRLSKIGQMRCFYQLGNHQFAAAYATKVLLVINDDADLEVQAQYIEGMSLRNMNEYELALVSLRKAVEITKSALGAEAKYNIAEIYFEQGNHEESEVEIMELVRQKPSYDYWIARAIILLADNYVAVKDYFNAKHSLESVIEGYEGDDDIVATALAKLKEIEALEAAEEESKRIIEDEIDESDPDEVDDETPDNIENPENDEDNE